jgi:hypothetical protein
MDNPLGALASWWSTMRAKILMLLAALMAGLWLLCIAAVVVQLVRGVWDHGQWFFVIAWLVAAQVCKGLAYEFRAGAVRYLRQAASPDATPAP